jgi:hypothetical protein
VLLSSAQGVLAPKVLVAPRQLLNLDAEVSHLFGQRCHLNVTVV